MVIHCHLIDIEGLQLDKSFVSKELYIFFLISCSAIINAQV